MSVPVGENTFGRHASFTPNESEGAEPIQLRYDQFDTALRQPTDKNRNMNTDNQLAQANQDELGLEDRREGGMFSRDWWNKWKVLVAAVILAVLLVLIIVLPIILTIGQSSPVLEEPRNGTELSAKNFTLDVETTTNRTIMEEVANITQSTSSTVKPTTFTTSSSTSTSTTSSTTTTSTSTSSAFTSPELASHVDKDTEERVLSRTAKFVAKLPPMANCSGFGFRCVDNPNMIIGSNQRCDGRIHCPDGSDEENCIVCQTAMNCPMKNGEKDVMKCLRGDTLCDGKVDCPTEIDEQLYCKETCDVTEYKCSGETAGLGMRPMCIPLSFFCDGDAHCKFADDETKCDAKSCQRGSMWCESDRRCIAKWHMCDGLKHCSDGSDERNCDCRGCSGEKMGLCSDTDSLRQCISSEKICDGVDDCPDRQDEINCPGSCQLERERDRVRCADGEEYPRRWACSGLINACLQSCPECDPELAFACSRPANHCIPRIQMCDNVRHCPDGSDETAELCFCNGQENKTGTSFICPAPLAGNGLPKCIPAIYRCDGYPHCHNGEDELDCDSCFNNPLAFHCPQTRQCFTSANRCDGIVHCPDYSDEDNCPCHECKNQRYPTYMCSEGGRCLKREDVCNAFSANHCPGTSPEDETFCVFNKHIFHPRR